MTTTSRGPRGVVCCCTVQYHLLSGGAAAPDHTGPAGQYLSVVLKQQALSRAAFALHSRRSPVNGNEHTPSIPAVSRRRGACFGEWARGADTPRSTVRLTGAGATTVVRVGPGASAVRGAAPGLRGRGLRG